MRDVLAAFPSAKQSGDGWSARCPAHADGRPSLSIGQGDDGKWLLTCHAGCSQDAILAAANLEPQDLFPKTDICRPRDIVAEYDYTAEDGTRLYQGVRLRPKGFKLRRPDGRAWVWNLNGVRRVLYRLPALQGQRTVFIVEGEKDVNRLVEIGLTATTNDSGAGKWRDAYTKQLTAAGVHEAIVIADNDTVGMSHARKVAARCHASGITTTLLTLPVAPKGDVSDYLAVHGKDDLLTLVAGAPPLVPTGPLTVVTGLSGAALGGADRRSDGGGKRADTPAQRTVTLTPASAITPRPVRWLWADRLALGTLALLGGREGVGKTILAYTLTASITRGTLVGAYLGTPRAVIVAATEDSWEHTIVPRLMAAGADRTRVYRIDVATPEGTETTLSLPADLVALERVVRDEQVALILLDPLLSRLATTLDTHKDADVRVALEPLVKLAFATDAHVLGLIHVNKSDSSDVLTQLMASRAFAAVARAVLFVMVDPEDSAVRLLGQAKNNLGRTDLPTLTLRIDAATVGETGDAHIETGKLVWLGETHRSITDAVDAAAAASPDRTATRDAADWLSDFLAGQGGVCESQEVKRVGKKAGHSEDALKRARQRLGVRSESITGFPRRTSWHLTQSEQVPGGSPPTAPTAPTAPTERGGRHIESTAAPTRVQSEQSVQSVQLGDTPQDSAPIGEEDDDDELRSF